MTSLYTVTAENSFFYANMAVIADSAETAEILFNGFCRKELRTSAKVEVQNARQVADKPSKINKADYEYRFDAAAIKEHEADDTIARYFGDIGRDVVMTSSGANG